MSLSPLQPLHKRPVATLQAASVEAQPKPSNARPVNPNAVRFSSSGWLGAFLRSPAATYVATAEANQSVAKFTQDTLSVWCPKIIIARSWAERTELTFLEFIVTFFDDIHGHFGVVRSVVDDHERVGRRSATAVLQKSFLLDRSLSLHSISSENAGAPFLVFRHQKRGASEEQEQKPD